jgi:hypothetical protein
MPHRHDDVHRGLSLATLVQDGSAPDGHDATTGPAASDRSQPNPTATAQACPRVTSNGSTRGDRRLGRSMTIGGVHEF